MNPSDSQPQSTPPEWFNQIPSADPLPPEPTTPNPRRKFVILSGLIGIALLLCVVAGSILTYRILTACLTTEDYRELAGKELQDPGTFSPKDNFYTETLLYENKTATIADVKDNPDQAVLVTKVATFYKKHSGTRPMTITISGGYTGADTKEAAAKRITSLAAALVAQGVKESAIISEEPTEIITEGELSADSDELKTARTYLSLASSPDCTE